MSVEYTPAVDDLAQQFAAALPPNVFLLNTGNYDFVRGNKKRIGNSRVMLLIIAIVATIAGVIVWNTSKIASELEQLEVSGFKAEATIVDGRSVRGRRSTSYYINYRYQVDGISYTDEQEISSNTYRRLRSGDEVLVRYLPNDPTVSALSGEFYDDTVRRENLIISIIVLVIGGVIILILGLVDYRNRRYSYRGQLLRGEIIESKGRRGSKGAYNVTVKYRFRTPSGKILEKKSTADRRDLRENLPQPGTPVMVLYVSDRMQRLM